MNLSDWIGYCHDMLCDSERIIVRKQSPKTTVQSRLSFDCSFSLVCHIENWTKLIKGRHFRWNQKWFSFSFPPYACQYTRSTYPVNDQWKARKETFQWKNFTNWERKFACVCLCALSGNGFPISHTHTSKRVESFTRNNFLFGFWS
jgi:hypothetical protein